MTRRLLELGLLVAVVAAPAVAEHEIFYRYTVLGYVKDAAGKPSPGQSVELIRDKTGFSYLGHTDEAGLFVIVVRLGTTQQRLVARFDAANHTDERGTRVDLEGARVLERPAWFRSTLATLLGVPKP